MADGDKKIGPEEAAGEVASTGSAITVNCGFRPTRVLIRNRTGEATLDWLASMPDDSGYKINGTGSGTAAAQTFTGTAPSFAENFATPAFSGTGQTSSGQVITTTDNQTMTLNQCTGMWFISAEHGPYMIESNTAVTGAPAVLTIYGTAPTTDAGTYKILKAGTPAGTNGTSAVTGGSSDTAFITSGGITPTPTGFILSTDTDINPAGSEVIYWSATKN